MKATIAVVVFGLMVGQVWSCIYRGIECIDYEVIARHPTYEERQYPNVLWMKVSGSGLSMSRAQIEMYRKLFRYIQGDNELELFINSTSPVRTKVIPCRALDQNGCVPRYTMSMPMPKELYDNLPAPNDTDIVISSEKPARYLVRTFGGRPSETDWLKEAHKLVEDTQKEPGVVKSHYFLSWYDEPLRMLHRKNEVWVPKNEPGSKRHGANTLDIWAEAIKNEVC